MADAPPTIGERAAKWAQSQLSPKQSQSDFVCVLANAFSEGFRDAIEDAAKAIDGKLLDNWNPIEDEDAFVRLKVTTLFNELRAAVVALAH